MTYVYILRSLRSPKQLYVGSTSDLVARLGEHNLCTSRHTSKFAPWQIVYHEKFQEQGDGIRRELQIKKWTHQKKEALINGNMVLLKELSKRRKY